MTTETLPDAAIAIVGMAGRFPQADNIGQYWANLVEVRDCLTAGDSTGPDGWVPVKGVLADADLFDAPAFGISAREADVMDPQHRVFLGEVWHALENAAIDPARPPGRIGVFAATSMNSYLLRNLFPEGAALDSTGLYQALLLSDKDFLATRAAFHFDLRGPTITVQSACSSSAAAVHLATQSLLNGECDVAIAGGVSVSVPLADGYQHVPGSIFSPDGKCRPFDAAAAGTVPGNGVGVVVLRRLEDAVADHNRVHATILGSAMNNDGAGKVGFTAPGVDGQTEVIAEAIAVAGIGADAIGYVEAHGTATPMGDPIEVAALGQAFNGAPGPRLLGAVKGNIGHLDAAAGVAALIKAACAVKHGQVPGVCHFEQPNPQLELAAAGFEVSGTTRPWPRPGTRIAGVSSFGMGGGNVHLVVGEPPRQAPVTSRHVGPLALLVSGRDAAAVQRNARALADHLATAGTNLAGASATLSHTRRRLPRKSVVLATDPVATAERLRGLNLADRQPVTSGGMLWSFPGQGAQHPGMLRGLYAGDPLAAATVDECLALLPGGLAAELRPLLLEEPTPGAADALRQTRLAQPALFITEVVMARLLTDAGLAPDMLIGHSIGEFAAAHIAGVCGLADALRLVAARGELVQSMPAGAMLSVPAPADELVGLLPDAVQVAVINAPDLCVLGGPEAVIEALTGQLLAKGLATRRLHTSHAFHTQSMAGAVEPMRELVRGIKLQAPSIPLVANSTGALFTAEQACSPDYWAGHVLRQVRFGDGLATALDSLGQPAAVEVGPGTALQAFLDHQPGWSKRGLVVNLMRHPSDDMDDVHHYLTGLGRLLDAGLPVDLGRFVPATRAVTELPGTVFARDRHWVEPEPASVGGPIRVDATDLPEDKWTWAPTWQRLADTTPGRWARVVVSGTGGLADEAASALARYADEVVRHHDADPPAVEAEDLLLLVAEFDWDGKAATLRPATAGLADLLATGRALAAADRPRAIALVARNAYQVLGDEPVQPLAAAAAAGMVVLGQELGVPTVTVDLGGAPAGDLLAVAAACRGEIAIRGNRLWHPALQPQPLSGEPRPEVVPGGLYVVTGASGAIGAAAAAELAAGGAGPVLALVSRRQRPSRGPLAGRLAALAGLGAQVEWVVADLADEPATTRALAELVARHGPVRGIVHAAGQPSRGMLATKSAEDAWQVLGPKLVGMACLAELAGPQLAFGIVCSSITARTGSPGQWDYAAANAFESAFAERLGEPWTAVEWSTWRNTGMAGGGGSAPVGALVDRPLVHEELPAEPGQRRYGTTLTTDLWILADHRLQDKGLVPGTTYLELLTEVLAELAPGRPVEFSQVVFLTPVMVGDGEQARIETWLDEQPDDWWSFRVRSQARGRWTEHCTGRVHVGAGQLPPLYPDGPGPRVDAMSAPELAARLRLDEIESNEQLRFQFGPRWKESIRDMVVHTDGLGVDLALADRFAGDTDDFLLHPALLDLAGAAARVQARDLFYLPMTYQRLVVLRPLPATVHCEVRSETDERASGEVLTCSLDLRDEAGELVVQARGFTIKRINDAGQMRDQVDTAGPVSAAAVQSGELDPAAARRQLAGVLHTRTPAVLAICPVPADEFVARARAMSLTEMADVLSAPSATRSARPALAVDYVAPRTETERRVADIVGDVLGVEPVGLHDSFFDLGGHSLAAVQLSSRLTDEFGVSLPLQQLFDAPDVAGLVAALESGQQVGGQESITAVRRAHTEDEVAELSDEEVAAQLDALLAAEL